MNVHLKTAARKVGMQCRTFSAQIVQQQQQSRQLRERLQQARVERYEKDMALAEQLEDQPLPSTYGPRALERIRLRLLKAMPRDFMVQPMEDVLALESGNSKADKRRERRMMKKALSANNDSRSNNNSATESVIDLAVTMKRKRSGPMTATQLKALDEEVSQMLSTILTCNNNNSNGINGNSSNNEERVIDEEKYAMIAKYQSFFDDYRALLDHAINESNNQVKQEQEQEQEQK